MMKVKRICLLLIVMIFALSNFAIASDERIMFGEVTVDSVDGTTSLEIELLSKPAGKSATLVAAYMDPDTGKILSIGINPCSDVSLLDSDILSVTLEDKSEDGGVLSYNVWDSLGGNMSLLNNSPTAPAGVSADEDVSEALIMWEGALDDYDTTDELTYNIYDDGMLIAENCDSLEYNAEKLAAGTTYNFDVRAVDSEGKESEVGSVKTTTLTKNAAHTYDEYTQSPDGNFIFTGTLTEENRNFFVTKTQAGGLDCFWSTHRIANGAQSQAYLTYRFSDDYMAEIAGLDLKAVAYEFTYFDEGTAKMTFECRVVKADGNTQDRSLAITMTNTNSWKTIRRVYTLQPGDHFEYNNNLGNGYYNFRISNDAWRTTGLKVRDFKVYPIVDTAGKTDEYYTIKKNAGSYFTANGGTEICDLTTNAAGLELEEVDGRTGVNLSEIPGGEVTFKVTDNEIMAGDVNVVVTYYAPDENTTITFNGEEKSVTACGKWQKMSFDLTNIGSREYVISSNDDIIINAIRVIPAN